MRNIQDIKDLIIANEATAYDDLNKIKKQGWVVLSSIVCKTIVKKTY